MCNFRFYTALRCVFRADRCPSCVPDWIDGRLPAENAVLQKENPHVRQKLSQSIVVLTKLTLPTPSVLRLYSLSLDTVSDNKQSNPFDDRLFSTSKHRLDVDSFII